MSKTVWKLGDDELDRMQLQLTNAQRRVFCTVERPRADSARRVRAFIAPEAGRVVEITMWLKYANFRFDAKERAIVTGSGFSAAQDVTEAISAITHMQLRHEGDRA